MVRRVIATFSLFLFVGLASLPLLSGEVLCNENCCASATLNGCKDDVASCPDMITSGNDAIIFPLVSAPLSSYHPDTSIPVTAFVLAAQVPGFTRGTRMPHLYTVVPSPPENQLTPLLI